MKIILLAAAIFAGSFCTFLVLDLKDKSGSSARPFSDQADVKPNSALQPMVRSGRSSAKMTPDEWIVFAARDNSVPAGAIYGIWTKESARLSDGWGEGKGWLVASEAVKPGGACRLEYDAKRPGFCQTQWNALMAICGQKLDGRPICDPRQVRTSYALAMGPMQHLPANIMAPDKHGRMALTDYAFDADGDGVVDPHRIGDAVAMTARFLHRQKKPGVSWQYAVNSYFGSQKFGYLEGTVQGEIGVVDHWRAWCRTHVCRRHPSAPLAYADNR